MSVESENIVKLNEKLGSLLLDQKLTDCSFIFLDQDGNQMKDDKFHAHTCILSSASDVFEAMFYGELKEKSPIVIEDIQKPIFEKLIG